MYMYTYEHTHTHTHETWIFDFLQTETWGVSKGPIPRISVLFGLGTSLLFAQYLEYRYYLDLEDVPRIPGLFGLLTSYDKRFLSESMTPKADLIFVNKYSLLLLYTTALPFSIYGYHTPSACTYPHPLRVHLAACSYATYDSSFSAFSAFSLSLSLSLSVSLSREARPFGTT